jgi:hypothetical protein
VRWKATGVPNLQDTGVFNQKVQSRGMQEAMMSDPSFMVDMMKKNLTGLVPQVRAVICEKIRSNQLVLGLLRVQPVVAEHAANHTAVPSTCCML